ncbi:hypothetical protein AURDEDRAFT_178820 [Auricularia subglabra TFB-10046 SS5]|nr:hypothetical protein AURDEDRAFT_178820 [Auricularia subglabra TFB-10046 SS5]
MSDGWVEEQHYELRVWKSALLASFVVLVWDWFICLDDEVEWIWKRRRNMFTVLWFVRPSKRNGPEERAIAFLPTLLVCAGMLYAHVVFLLRTWALYGRSSKILLILSGALGIEAVFLFLCLIKQHVVVPPPGHGCLPGSPRLVFGVMAWVAPLFFDTLVFGFTLSRTMRFVRQEGSGASLFYVFLRDGVIYFGVMFMCYLTAIVTYVIAPPGLKDMNAGISGLTLVMTARLLLSMRKAVQRPDDKDNFSMSASHHVTFVERTRAYVETLVAEMEAGVQRERRIATFREATAPEVASGIFRTHTIQLQDMRRT